MPEDPGSWMNWTCKDEPWMNWTRERGGPAPRAAEISDAAPPKAAGRPLLASSTTSPPRSPPPYKSPTSSGQVRMAAPKARVFRTDRPADAQLPAPITRKSPPPGCSATRPPLKASTPAALQGLCSVGPRVDPPTPLPKDAGSSIFTTAEAWPTSPAEAWLGSAKDTGKSAGGAAATTSTMPVNAATTSTSAIGHHPGPAHPELAPEPAWPAAGPVDDMGEGYTWVRLKTNRAQFMDMARETGYSLYTA